MDSIHLTIVVEEHTKVVDVSLHVVVLPRTANVFRGVALQSLAVHVGINIKLSVGITDARSPDALSVYLLMIFQRKAVFWKIKAVEAVAHILPVYEVLGMEYNQSWHGVHGGTCQIIVVAHTKYVWV